MDNKEEKFELWKERSVVDWIKTTGEEFHNLTYMVYELRSNITSDGLYPRKLTILLKEKERKNLKEVELVNKQRYLEYLLSSEGDEETDKEADKEVKKFEEAEKLRDAAYLKLQKAKRLANRTECEIDEISVQLAEARKRSERMYYIVLVHKSADIARVMENCKYEQIFVTAEDSAEPDISDNLRINGIFEDEDNENFINALPYYFHNKYDEKDQKSIISFCEMIIYFKMKNDDDKVIPIFSNQDISAILKLNGLEI